MKFFKEKKYSVMDIGLIKWSCILFGMVLGAYIADFVQSYVWLFIVIALLLAVKPLVTYFKES